MRATWEVKSRKSCASQATILTALRTCSSQVGGGDLQDILPCSPEGDDQERGSRPSAATIKHERVDGGSQVRKWRSPQGEADHESSGRGEKLRTAPISQLRASIFRNSRSIPAAERRRGRKIHGWRSRARWSPREDGAGAERKGRPLPARRTFQAVDKSISAGAARSEPLDKSHQ